MMNWQRAHPRLPLNDAGHPPGHDFVGKKVTTTHWDEEDKPYKVTVIHKFCRRCGTTINEPDALLRCCTVPEDAA